LFFFIYIYKINDTDPALIICRAALILQRDLEAGNFTLLMLKRAAQIKVAQVNPAFIYFRSISGSFTSGPKRFVSIKKNKQPPKNYENSTQPNIWGSALAQRKYGEKINKTKSSRVRCPARKNLKIRIYLKHFRTHLFNFPLFL
jgi:hypothetical protein